MNERLIRQPRRGSWRCYNSIGGKVFKQWRIIDDNGDLIATIANQPDGSDVDIADLIAAAPDMLIACRAALSIIRAEQEACGIYKAHTKLIEDAITLAEEGTK